MYKFVWEFSSKSNTKLFHKLKKKKSALHFGGQQVVKQISMKPKIPKFCVQQHFADSQW